MIKRVLVLLLCGVTLLVAESSPLLKTKQAFSMDVKRYDLPGGEDITLYGGKRRHFLTDTWYWGESGYGSVTGERSGYLEGGVIAGWLNTYQRRWLLETRAFFGAGGGGGAQQGSGMIFNPVVVAGVHVAKDVYLNAELGYIWFLNGEIESPTVGLSLTTFLWELSTRSER